MAQSRFIIVATAVKNFNIIENKNNEKKNVFRYEHQIAETWYKRKISVYWLHTFGENINFYSDDKIVIPQKAILLVNNYFTNPNNCYYLISKQSQIIPFSTENENIVIKSISEQNNKIIKINELLKKTDSSVINEINNFITNLLQINNKEEKIQRINKFIMSNKNNTNVMMSLLQMMKPKDDYNKSYMNIIEIQNNINFNKTEIAMQLFDGIASLNRNESFLSKRDKYTTIEQIEIEIRTLKIWFFHYLLNENL